MRMRNFLYVMMLLGLLGATTACTNANEQCIEVNGTAKVDIVPEMAVFSFSISERGRDLGLIKNRIDKKTARLVHLCKKFGIDAKDISAAEMAITPHYQYEQNRFIGYEVSRDVKATLYDLKKYTALIDGAIAAGISTIDNITLDTKQRGELQTKALQAALRNARQKAEIIADTSYVKLGQVRNIKEGTDAGVWPSHNYLLARGETDQKANVFEPGVISVSKSVTVVFEIQ